MTGHAAPRVVVTTAPHAGAVAIVQLHGRGSAALLAEVAGNRPIKPGRVVLRDIPGIDQAVVVVLDDGWCQMMPHGGQRVVQKLVDRLLEHGAVYEPDSDPLVSFPEARSLIEADVLAAIARAASPAAIDLLAAQPAAWRDAVSDRQRFAGDFQRQEILHRSAVLDRLIHPPMVVVVGQPNVGKSTLTNTMLGRAVSIVSDLPGTTRDWVAGMAELLVAGSAPGGRHGAVAVRWLDTPGLRASGDAIEQEAIAIARQMIASADVLIAMRDPQIGWPDLETLPARPHLYVMNKVDNCEGEAPGAAGTTPQDPLPISARTDRGLDRLQTRILAALELAPDKLDPLPLWAFSDTLRRVVRDEGDLAAYVDVGRGRMSAPPGAAADG